MPGHGWLTAFTLVGLSVLTYGCGNSDRLPTSPTITIPTPAAAPAPAPVSTLPDSVLSGVVFEVTSAGRRGLEGATVYLLTCGAGNCPRELTAAYEVKTDKGGAYRITGVYRGSLNFLWVRDEVFELVDPMPPGTCPDYCDRVVTINGETRLDVDLRRR